MYSMCPHQIFIWEWNRNIAVWLFVTFSLFLTRVSMALYAVIVQQRNRQGRVYFEISKNITIITLTQWGRVTHICVGNLTIIGPNNGLSPGRRQAIIWTNAGLLLIGPLGTNFSEILIGIQTFSFKKMHLKMSSAKRRPFVSASMF